MADNLFTWLDALWNKSQPTGTPPIFMMHRFMASDRNLAAAARTLQLDLMREPHIAFRVWQGLLPKGQGAPRFTYVAAKKPPAAEELTIRMMHVLAESRPVVEEMQKLIALARREMELYLHFGVEPPKQETTATTIEPATKEEGGLLANI